MHRSMPSLVVEPLIHGVDVMLKKIGWLMGWSPRDRAGECFSMFGGERNVRLGPFAANERRDLVNLPALSEQVVAQYKADADARSVRLLIDVAPDALVMGNSIDLHRAVEILVVNALKETPDGGRVTLFGSVSHGIVVLTLSSDHAFTRPTVPPGLRKGLCVNGQRRSFDVLGFDSSFIGRILRAHGGWLETSEQPGYVTRIVIHLPVA